MCSSASFLICPNALVSRSRSRWRVTPMPGTCSVSMDGRSPMRSAGKPVITQDTGFGNILPTGRGLFAFQIMEHVLEALNQINAQYDEHSRAAREIAQEYFASERVLTSLLKEVGL
jgi:hypothetical protein